MIRHNLLIGATMAVGLGLCGQARAAPIDVTGLVAKACSRADLAEGDRPQWLASLAADEKVAVVLPRNRLLAFLLADSGLLENEGAALTQLERQIKFVQQMQGAEFQSLAGKRAIDIVDDLEFLQSQLSTGELDNLKVIRLDGSAVNASTDRHWLLDDENRFACIYDADGDTGKKKAEGLIAIFDAFRLRETSEALGLVGEARKTAPSANLSYKRERMFLDDGTAKRTSTIALKAVVGYPFFESDYSVLTAYAGYEINRVRSRPAPVLTPPETQRDSDTEILKFGFFGRHDYNLRSSAGFSIEVDGAFLNDYVKDSNRLRIKVGLTPNFAKDELGFCALGRLNSARKNFLGIQGKCTFQFLGEVNHLTKAGALILKPKDEFILLGGRAAVDFQFSEDLEKGLIGGLEYRYLETVHGRAPNMDRFKAYFKYRFWLKDAALDVGFEYIDGTNPDSFADDNSLMLAVGLML